MIFYKENPIYLLIVWVMLSFSLCSACDGQDRAEEQPLKPTVKTGNYTISESESGKCVLNGQVMASPNSSLKECGFVYGNDTLKATAIADLSWAFSCSMDSLQKGTYYYVAYATNGVGTSYGDTLFFVIP